MSQDLIIGSTNLDWSRTPVSGEIATAAAKPAAMKPSPANQDGNVMGSSKFVGMMVTNRINQIWSNAVRSQNPTQRELALLRKASSKGNSRAQQCLSWLSQHGISGRFVGASRLGRSKDEVEVALDGGACERAALSRSRGECGIVISDKEIKDSLVGHHRHHHRHRRGQGQPGQIPGQYPGQFPGQYPGQYQGQPTGAFQPDPQKLQLLRNAYRQIRSGHINWMANQDHQNNVWTTPASTYLQAAKLWARQQLQQQQLPIRSDPSTQGQWQQPLSWFQSQTQAALNSAASQMSSQITSTQPTAGTPYPPSPYYPAAASYAVPQPTPSSPTSNAYYPAPGSFNDDDPSLDDDQGDVAIGGWPNPLLMHGNSFRSDESRAEGENSSSCGDVLPHGQYRALVMKQAIRNAGGRRPSTKHLFAAKKTVDNALGTSGVAIYIPGASPARRTV